MKYAGNYYSKLKNFGKTRCNLNYLAWDIEKWQKTIRFNRKSPDTSRLMIDDYVPYDVEKFNEVEKVFIEFNKEMQELQKQQGMVKNFNDYRDFFEGYTKEEIQNTDINWDIVYDKYKDRLKNISVNQKELANYAVYLSYVKYPNKSKNFCWVITEEGLLLNLERNRELNIKFPMEVLDSSGMEYLGRYYVMEELLMGELQDV